MRYKSITPATDWFYVHGSAPPPRKETIWHVAAFALTDDGDVIGLVPVSGPFSERHTARLVPPPNLQDGQYLHRDQLTPNQLEASKKA